MSEKKRESATLLQEYKDCSPKTPPFGSIKSQKLSRVLAPEPELSSISINSNKPFKRRQQLNNYNNPNSNISNCSAKKRQDDIGIGKVIRNTFYASQTDLRKLLACSPDIRVQGKSQQELKDSQKAKPKDRYTLRQNKSVSQLQKFDSSLKQSPAKLLGSLQNLNSKIINKAANNNEQQKQKQKQSYPYPYPYSQNINININPNQHKLLKNKLQLVLNSKNQLQQKYDKLDRKNQKLEAQILEKQAMIKQLHEQLQQRNKDNEQIMQINKCLQEIISKLNSKIQCLLQAKQPYSRHIKVEKEETTTTPSPKLSELQIKDHEFIYEHSEIKQQGYLQDNQEVSQLREQIYHLNRTVHSLQIQVILCKRLRAELQKQKNNVKCMEKDNKILKERILFMMKNVNHSNGNSNGNNKFKPVKMSLKRQNLFGKDKDRQKQKQLQYSVSFSFQQQLRD